MRAITDLATLDFLPADRELVQLLASGKLNPAGCLGSKAFLVEP
jgi:hypothetical protein